MTARSTLKAKASTPTPAPLPPPVPDPAPNPAPVPVRHYVAGRRMNRDGGVYEVGDAIPDAGDWLRLESWLRTGYVKEVWS